MRKPPRSSRRFVGGPSGSGKTHLLRVWAREFPRQLVLDVTGEWAGQEDRDEWCRDWPAVGQRLRRVASLSRWRVVVPSDRVDLEALVALCVPTFRPGRTSFPRAVGGMALVIDEAAELASHEHARVVRPLWLRGRHHGLTILAASQRSADVGRMVTSQSDVVAVTRQDEPIDIAYWRKALRPEWYAAMEGLPRFHAVVVDRVKGLATVQTTAGEIVRVLGRRAVEEPGA